MSSKNALFIILIFLLSMFLMTSISAKEVASQDNLTDFYLDDDGNIVVDNSSNVELPDINLPMPDDGNGCYTDIRNRNNITIDEMIELMNTSQPIDAMPISNDIQRISDEYDCHLPGSLVIGDYLVDYKYADNPCYNVHYKADSLFRQMPNMIKSENFNAFYSNSNYFKVQILDFLGHPVGKDVNVTFKLNGKVIKAKTDKNGYAKLKINAKPGKYTLTTTVGDVASSSNIVIKSPLKTKNISKKYKKAAKFTVKLVKNNGKVYPKQLIKITFKGKVYKYKTNSKGLVSFKIPKNLKKGKYVIKTTYNGYTVKNKITVK